MDDLVELLTLTDHFQLSSGLVVVPDFSVPKGWKPRSETVTIVRPNGESREAKARLAVEHFLIRDPAVSVDRRWRLVVSFPTMTKEEVPIGSKVMVPQSLRASIQLD
jgi:hypothetical protein